MEPCRKGNYCLHLCIYCRNQSLQARNAATAPWFKGYCIHIWTNLILYKSIVGNRTFQEARSSVTGAAKGKEGKMEGGYCIHMSTYLIVNMSILGTKTLQAVRISVTAKGKEGKEDTYMNLSDC